MSDVYAILADPARRQILDLVRDGERAVGDLVESCGLPQPSVSKKLRILHDAGLVRVRHDGSKRMYSLRPAPLMEVDAWLAHYRRHWTSRLDALERALDKSASKKEATHER